MLDTELQEKIDSIYLEYINDLKPLIAYVEHNYRKFPKGVLKEFRDVFDHIARLYLDGQSDAVKADNIKKADNHFCRLKLDIYKYSCDYQKRKIDRWMKRYSKYDLTIIDNGKFWDDVEERFDKCETTFFKGREIEHSDIAQACNYYEDYINECEDTFNHIDAKKNLISSAVYKQRRTQTINIIIGFILGIIGSLIASGIYAHLFASNNINSDEHIHPSPSVSQVIIKDKE